MYEYFFTICPEQRLLGFSGCLVVILKILLYGLDSNIIFRVTSLFYGVGRTQAKLKILIILPKTGLIKAFQSTHRLLPNSL
jgi:cellulose synthase/poly-beta-1,6-N-acetylglucosamine synthase-like glycosyltransferase